MKSLDGSLIVSPTNAHIVAIRNLWVKRAPGVGLKLDTGVRRPFGVAFCCN